MPVYHYAALDTDGLHRQGSVEAGDTHTAAQMLRARSLYVVRLDALDEAAPAAPAVGAWFAQRLPVRSQDLLLFFRQLGLMLRNGLTLLQALETAATTSASRPLKRVIAALREAIEGGAGLSQALARHPRCFSSLTVELVRGAEASGELDTVMERIAADMERNADLRRQFVTSMLYPVIVLLASIGVSAFLVVVVVPEFAKFFAKSGRPLPPATQALLDVSNFMVTWGPYIVLLLAAVAAGIYAAWRDPRTRPAVDRRVLGLPVIGNIVRTGNIARFAWSAALLVKSGITLLESLRVAAGVLGNAAIAADVRAAAESVLSGRDLASSLKGPTIPLLVPQLAAVGERTGALDAVLQEIGNYYQKLLEVSMKRLTAAVEPVLILLVGGMVGFVYYAFFQALFAAAG